MKLRYLIAFFLSFFLFFNLKAEEQTLSYIEVDSLSNSYSLDNNFYSYEDKSSSLIIDSVIALDFQSNFKICKRSNFDVDSINSTFWFKINFVNVSSINKNLLLEVKNSKIQNIDFYEFKNTSFINNGNNRDLINLKKQVKQRRTFFSIHLKTGSNYTYFIRIKNYHPTKFSFLLRTHKQLIKEKSKYLFFDGIYFGVLFFMFVFALISYFLVADFKFLSFSIYTILTIFFLLNIDGFFFEYFWETSYLWNEYSSLFLQGAVIISLAMFSKSVIKSNCKVVSMNRTFIFVLILTLAILILSIYKPLLKSCIGLIDVFLVVTPILCLKNYFKVFNRKNLHFLYYIITYSLFTIFVLFAIIHNFGLIGNNFFTNNALKIAFITHILFVFLISINKYLNLNLLPFYNNIRNDIYEELQTQNDVLQQQNAELESQKEELNTQQDVIKANNVELGKLKIAIGKTKSLIYIFNTEGYLLWYNASFSSLLEKSIERFPDLDKININICDISYNKDVKNKLENCVLKRQNITYETIFKKDGIEECFQTTLNPIIDENGVFKSIIAIDTDITKLKKYEKEISKQKQDLEEQKNIAVLRRSAIETQKKEITDSLKYAQRIQDAILPNTKKLFSTFEGFVILKPKDIVSGDFYWYQHIKGKHVIIGVDCTGHGVPGAFMSIVGTYLLNDIIIHNQVTDPAKILKLLNRKVKIALKVEDPSVYTNDGMDMSVCVVDKENNTLEYAGAMRPLFLFNGNKFVEINGDKKSIKSDIANHDVQSFTNHLININKGDVFYIFSDGIIDQFGGERNKKFLSKRFQQVLKDIYFMDMKEQKQIIVDGFNDWKGENEQVDDVFVLGIRY
ncbi:MAG: SpoIIE family protein phosphatase [Bacteroidetes bacterium]|nr:SpoIIE family protein phosphatase [Bacteroidota bacterium]